MRNKRIITALFCILVMFMSAIPVSAVEDMPPEIDEVTHEPFYPTTMDSVDVCAEVTDDVSVELVEVHWESMYEDEFNSGFATMAHVDGDTYCKSPLSFGLLGIVDGRMVTYYVTAEDGVNEPSVSGEYSFTYDGADPTADAGGPYTCDEGTTQVLDGSDSDDTVDDELTFAWDLDNDGLYDDSDESNPDFACVDDSVNTVSLKVTDNVGNEDVDTTTVTVENVAPEADAGGEDLEIEELPLYYCSEGQTTVLDASASSDVEADELSFAWDFDDDELFDDAVGATPEYTCGNGDAEFVVAVQVTDDDGGVSEASATVVVVSNEAPEVDAGDDVTADEGEEVTINPMFTDFQEDTHSASVCWGDESCDGFSEEDFVYDGEAWSFSASHTYVDEGEYEVEVTVEDLGELGGSEGSDSLTVNVENVAPVITDTGEPYTGVAGDSICFYAEATDQGVEDYLSYEWDFDGYSEDNCYTWYDDFEGTVTLTVTDGDGGEAQVEVPVTVYDYGIELGSGQNLISIPLVPENTDVEAVLNGVNPESVWAYQYNPETQQNEWYFHPGEDAPEGVGNLHEMIPGYGYYVLMGEESDMLFNNGDKFYTLGEGQSLPPEVVVVPGWNLIGHYGLNEVMKDDEVMDLAGGLLTDLADVTVLNEDSFPLSSSAYLVPGEGYWAFITGQDNELYAPSAADYDDEYYYD